MNKVLIISVLAIVLLSVTVTSISAQSKYDIPAWVKGVAGFWSEGKITNDEFGDGLSFLIDNDIIKVPKIKQLESENSKLKNDIIKLQYENTKLQSGNTQNTAPSGNTQPTQNPTMIDAERCSAIPKPNIDLHGCNLSGANLSDSDLGSANFSDANLQNVNFSGARLEGANFSGANLSGANLNGVYFSGGAITSDYIYTNFNGANLSGITYSGCIGSALGTPSTGTLPICMAAP